MGKDDLQQLKGILEQFDPEITIRAVAEYLGGDSVAEIEKIVNKTVSEGVADTGGIIRKSYKDFPDPGPKVSVGEERSVVELNDLSVPYSERIIGEANFLPVHFLEKGAAIQRAVARVVLKSGQGWATGFMVSPTLFLTNNHVIPDVAFASSIEAQFQYQLDYNGLPKQVDIYQFDPNSVFHTNVQLDYTLIGMRKKSIFSVVTPVVPVVVEASSLIDSSNLINIWKHAGNVHGFIPLQSSVSYADKQHVNIVQHPAARRKEVALQQNNIQYIYNNHVRYTTDTEPGSSGSPVFNNSWGLILLHHAGGDVQNGVWINNEGVRIDKIVADIRNHFGANHAVVTELGI